VLQKKHTPGAISAAPQTLQGAKAAKK